MNTLDADALNRALSDHERDHHGVTASAEIPSDCMSDLKRRYDAIADNGLTSIELAQAILVATKEDGRRPTSDGFEWYGSADELAGAILDALRAPVST